MIGIEHFMLNKQAKWRKTNSTCFHLRIKVDGDLKKSIQEKCGYQMWEEYEDGSMVHGYRIQLEKKNNLYSFVAQ